jgi:hypothetical protein
VLVPEAQISAIVEDNSIPRIAVREAEGYVGMPAGGSPFQDESASVVKWIYNDRPEVQRLNVSECISAYATTKNRIHGDALIVTAGSKINYTDEFTGVLGFNDFTAYQLASPENFLFDPDGFEIANNAQYGTAGPFDWMCFPETILNEAQMLCSAKNVALDGDWTYGSNKVLYCLSRVMQPACELNFSLPIAFAVLACNLGKLAAMILALYMRRDNVLLTLGDAIASFLQHEDLHEACDQPSDPLCRQFRNRVEVLRSSGERSQDEMWLVSWVRHACFSALVANLMLVTPVLSRLGPSC